MEMFFKAKALVHTPSVPGPRTPAHSQSWTPPPPHLLKIIVDASWTTGCGSGAVGVLMRDHAGRCLAVGRQEIVMPSVYAAEALAILEGCLLAQHHGISQFTEISDYVWVEKTPSSFVRILNKDGLPCPL
ncbi:hypothetical protein EV1_040817 [Malus domestica]